MLNINTLADIAGDNAVHAFSATALPARAAIIGAVGGALRIGDVNVSSSRGASLASGQTVVIGLAPQWTRDAFSAPTIDLSTVYIYVPSGATLTRTYLT